MWMVIAVDGSSNALERATVKVGVAARVRRETDVLFLPRYTTTHFISPKNMKAYVVAGATESGSVVGRREPLTISQRVKRERPVASICAEC